MATAVSAVVVLGWLAALCACDLRDRRLPNVLTLPGAVVILAGAVLAGRGGVAGAGALTLAGGYLVIHLIAPAAMGAGDVKLAVGLGALCGAFGLDTWLLAALGAPTLTATTGVLLRRRVLPHGPAMCLASAAALGVGWW